LALRISIIDDPSAFGAAPTNCPIVSVAGPPRITIRAPGITTNR